MATWDVIECDFGDDETRNFGPRDESSPLYQCDTVATISPDSEVTENPAVYGVASPEFLAISTDKTVSIFDESRQFVKSLQFETTVNVMKWTTPDSLFLVIGESSGCLHIIYSKTKEPISSQKLLQDDDEVFQDIIFSPLNTQGYCSIAVLSTSGKLFILSEVNTKNLSKALDQKDVEKVTELQRQLSTGLISTSPYHRVRTTSVAAYRHSGKEYWITTGVGKEDIICIWTKSKMDFGNPIRSVDSFLKEDVGILKCEVLCCGKFILVLDENRVLTLWDTQVLILLEQWPHIQLDDFFLLESDDRTNWKSLKVVGLILADNNVESVLKILTFPHLEAIYSIKLSSKTDLVHIPSTLDCIYLIEGVYADDSCPYISTMRVRALSEAHPQTRLDRLMRKNQFTEAEQFARQFDLDMQLVYTVKANFILESFSVNQNEDPLKVQNLLGQLISCLDQINDVFCVADCCVHAVLPTFEANVSLLQYVRKRLGKIVENKSADNKNTALTRLTAVYGMLRKAGTYQVLYGAETYSITTWEYCMKMNMFEEVLKWMKKGNLPRVFSIWNRHCKDFESSFTENCVHAVVNAIPDNTTSGDLLAWLSNDFFPFVLETSPGGLPLLANWLEQRVRNMELLEKVGWPENALNMAKSLLISCSMAQDKQIDTPSKFTRKVCYNWTRSDEYLSLQLLVKQLTEVLNLHKRYMCRLSLSQYTQENTESLTYRMLDRVMAIELIPKTIEKLVLPYMKEHRLNKDRLLFQYVEDLLQRLGKMQSFIEEAPWEGKATAVIDCIDDVEYKCRAIAMVMGRAYIPWTLGIEKLVNEGLKLDSPSVEDIKVQMNHAKFQKLLLKYELKHHKQKKAVGLITYIFKQDLPSAVEDALQVISYFHQSDIVVYTMRARYLIGNDRGQELLKLLKSLPKDIVMIVVRHIAIETEVVLNSTCLALSTNEMQKQRMSWASVCSTVLKSVLPHIDSNGGDRMSNDQAFVKSIENVASLQEKLNMVLTLDQYETDKWSILEKRIQNLVDNEEDQASDPSYSKNMFELYQLSELLDIPRDMLRGKLAVQLAKKGQGHIAVKLCQELSEYDVTQSTAEVLYKVTLSLCSFLADEKHTERLLQEVPNIPTILHEFASKALAFCSPDLIMDCLKLCQGTSLSLSVYEHCETGNYNLSVTKSESLCKEWQEDYFKEDGLMLSSSTAMPLTNRCTVGITHSLINNHQSQVLEENNEVKSCIKDIQKLVVYLQENSQEILALNCTVLATVVSSGYYGFLSTQSCVDLNIQQAVDNEGSNAKRMSLVAQNTSGQLMSSLLRKLFNQKPVQIDSFLALNFMCALPKEQATRELRKLNAAAGHHYRKILVLSQLGMKFADICGENGAIKQKCVDVKRNALWGKKLSKLKISFKDVYERDDYLKGQLLPVIVKHKSVDVSFIMDYCRAFSLDVNTALFQYLDSLLLSQPQQTATVSDSGDAPPCINQAMRDENKSLVIQCVEAISNEGELLKKLQAIFQQLDPYNYEQIELVLELIEHIHTTADTQRNITLLKYLMYYTRGVPPSDFEIDFVTASENENEDKLVIDQARCLPPNSAKRLPFHCLIASKHDAWKIISPELNGETIHKWLKIVEMFKLVRDNMFMTTVQNIITKHVTSRKDQSDWNSDTVNKRVFEHIEKLLDQVTVERAVMCANWIMKKLQPGAEKITVLRHLVLLSAKWLQSSEENTENNVKAHKSYKLYSDLLQKFQNEQILHLHDLADEVELMKLTGNPFEMIIALYEHDSTWMRSKVASSGNEYDGKHSKFPDVHKIANEIASVNELNVRSVVLQLVEKWLPSSQHTKQEEADMTMTMNFNVNLDETVSENQEFEDEKTLTKLIYLLSHESVGANVTFLLNFAFDSTKSSITNSCRVRALRCLFAIANHQQIEEHCKSIDHLKNTLNILLRLLSLERLGISHTISTFEKCNKPGLIRGIWQNHKHDPKAVTMVSDLCLDYDFFDPQLWNVILQQLLTFNLVDHLRQVLISLSGNPKLCQIVCIKKVWESVLLNILNSAVAPLTEKQKEESLQAVKMLHRCPFLLEMDLVHFSQLLLEQDMNAAALSCLLMEPSEDKRSHFIAKENMSDKYMNILNELSEIKACSQVLPLANQVEEFVYRKMDDAQDYSIMITPSMKSFVTFLVKEHRIKNLIFEALRNNRLQEAADLVNNYNEFHGLRGPEENSDQALVKDYFVKNDCIESVMEYLNLEDH